MADPVVNETTHPALAAVLRAHVAIEISKEDIAAIGGQLLDSLNIDVLKKRLARLK